MNFRLIVALVFISWTRGATQHTAINSDDSNVKLRTVNGTKWISSLLDAVAKDHELSTYSDTSSNCYKSVFGDKKVDTKDPILALKAVLLAKCVVVTDALSYPQNFYRKLSKTVTDIRRQDTWTTFLQQMASLPIVVLRSAIEQPTMTIARIYVFILSCVISELIVLFES